ncbi:MAG: Bacillopeptidase F [Anaerolineae bacterium]|nr:Bacillopeptidase F [Anaerolineae bacterium]
MQRSILLFIVFAFALLLVPPNLNAAPERPASNVAAPLTLQAVAGKIDRQVLASLQRGERTRALIVLAQQADVSAAKNLRTKAEKGAYVFNALRATAAQTQPEMRRALDQLGLSYRAYYVVNLFAVENLNAAAAIQLAARPEVGYIEGNPDVEFAQPTPSQAVAPESVNGVEWGIRKIRADKMWELGFKGQDIVVANQDTGVQWDHPALKNKYRGYDKTTGKAKHSYNWWDAIHHTIGGGANPCGVNIKKPCDDNDHGTHTMGTIVGGKGANKIGVAPGAKWISCRNMDRGVGRPNTYIECFEFFLAPWNRKGQNPDPAKAPDVVSNSWGCPTSEQCAPNSILTATENVRAAGIFVSVSAGNSGPGCSTVTDPSAIYDVATTIGATNAADALASFSSRGPVTADNSNRRKPDISAPGVNVRSSVPQNSYANFDGTSMAAPHVAGAVALLWQAKPALRGDVDATETLLFNSAFTGVSVANNLTCGGTAPTDIPNNLFGYGRLDIYNAYQSAP